MNRRRLCGNYVDARLGGVTPDPITDGANVLHDFDSGETVDPVPGEDWRSVMAMLGILWSGVALGVAGTLVIAGVM